MGTLANWGGGYGLYLGMVETGRAEIFAFMALIYDVIRSGCTGGWIPKNIAGSRTSAASISMSCKYCAYIVLISMRALAIALELR